MSSLFSSPKTPTPAPVATMPDDSSPAVLEAKRKAQADILARSGRSSTILTTPSTRPAAPTGDYASKALGPS